MLYRMLDENRMCITQPTHAWLSGQLAQAWGNDQFGAIAPREAVCLGAEQHDIGWVPWEAAPTLNPDTGYPHRFNEVPLEVHTRLWAGAKHLVMPMGRYAALLVSLHGTGLYERFTHWKNSPESIRIVEAFLTQEKAFQQALIYHLKDDSTYAPHVAPEAIARNQRLVATFDALSLMICMGIGATKEIEHVPTATDETSLYLSPLDGDPTQIVVEPWCFHADRVTVVFEGRILEKESNDEILMRAQLAAAPWATVTTTLYPGQR